MSLFVLDRIWAWQTRTAICCTVLCHAPCTCLVSSLQFDMLTVEAGCAVFQERVQAANPVRRIKLPNPWIACCTLGTINHCSATAAGEGARSVLAKDNASRAHGHPSDCCSHSPGGAHGPCHGRMLWWEMWLKGCSAPLSHHILQIGVLS